MKKKTMIRFTIILLWLFPFVSHAANYRSFFAKSQNENEIKFIFLGNSGVILNCSQGTVVIDPATLLADYDIEQLRQADNVVVLYTHGHGDHFNSSAAVQLQKATNAKILCDGLVYQTLAGKIAQEHLIEGLDGKSYDFGRLAVDVISGRHASPINLYRISMGRLRIFHGGDSGHVSLQNYPSDIAFVPTGMPSPSASPEDAFKMVADLKPKVVVTMHGAEHQHRSLEDSINSRIPDTTVVIPTKQVSKSIMLD